MPARLVQERPTVLAAAWGFIAYVIGVVVFSNTRREHDKRLSQAKAYLASKENKKIAQKDAAKEKSERWKCPKCGNMNSNEGYDCNNPNCNFVLQ